MSHLKQSIPFVAGNSTWEDWNGNMLHFFGEEPLPYVPELSWQDFGQAMLGLPTFSSYAIPSPERYEDWRDWVGDLITVINGPTN